MRWLARLLCVAITLAVVPAPALAYCMDMHEPGCMENPKVDVTERTRVTVDGRTCAHVPVVIYRNRTYMQLRSFAECLGLMVEWFPADRLQGEAVINGSVGAQGRGFTAYFKPQQEEYTVRIKEMGQPEVPFYLDVPPFILDGRTYVPLRSVTDAANVQVEWLPGHEGTLGINEVRVTTTERAKPLDQWEQATRYVGWTEEKGFHVIEAPHRGYLIYPSTLRQTRHAVELYNRLLKEKGTAGVNLDFNGMRVREYVENGMVDYFGPVTVRWFTDDLAAMRYQREIEIAEATVKGGALAANIGLTIFFGAQKAILQTLTFAAGSSVSTWSLFSGDWLATFRYCQKMADLSDFKKQRPFGAPAIWGVAYTPNRMECVPFYSEDPLSIMQH